MTLGTGDRDRLSARPSEYESATMGWLWRTVFFLMLARDQLYAGGLGGVLRAGHRCPTRRHLEHPPEPGPQRGRQCPRNLRALIVEAAATALDREAQWVRLSENLAEDEELQAVRYLQRLMRQLSEEGASNPDAVEPLGRVQARIARTIDELTAVRDAIAEAQPDQEA